MTYPGLLYDNVIQFSLNPYLIKLIRYTLSSQSYTYQHYHVIGCSGAALFWLRCINLDNTICISPLTQLPDHWRIIYFINNPLAGNEILNHLGFITNRGQPFFVMSPIPAAAPSSSTFVSQTQLCWMSWNTQGRAMVQWILAIEKLHK